MWSLNGHSLSKMFTGSRALEGKAKVGAGRGGAWGRAGARGAPPHGPRSGSRPAGGKAEGRGALRVPHHPVQPLRRGEAGSHQAAAGRGRLHRGGGGQGKDAAGQHGPAGYGGPRPAPGGMEAARAGPPAPRAAPAGGRWTVPSCRALRSAGTPARPGDMSGLQLRVVFFYEMGSHVWPQEEAERLRKKTKFFMLMGPRDGRVRGAHRATWKVPMVARGQKAGAGEHVGRGLYRAFRGKGRAGRAARGRPV